VIEGDRVVHEVRYPHPVQAVWAAVTGREAVAIWLMPNDFEPVAGHRFQLDARPAFGIIDGLVLDAEAAQLLRCRWTIEGVDTIVTIRLQPDGDGTLLRLEHVGLTGPRHLEFDPGWGSKLTSDLPGLLARH
jgi:uncharacterized protein YndB with AHSA1/START domain